jgi:ligand-binding SRPBCC domain-containing protein
MKCVVRTRLRARARDVWPAIKRSDTLLMVTKGFLCFRDTGKFPQIWEEGVKVDTGFIFFHILPAWWVHTMEVKLVDDDNMILRSHEYGGMIKYWDHTISAVAAGDGCEYSDEIAIDAGIMTIPVWLYANIFYRYRQMRWRSLLDELVKSGEIK